MGIMQSTVEGEAFQVDYDPAAATVVLRGMMRLNGLEEYAPVAEVLARAAAAGHAALILDLRELEFLNSSGIAMLSRFVIDTRNRQTVALTIRGARAIAWQGKSLVNLQRLMPALTMEMV